MIEYPSVSLSIGQDFQEFDAHVFDKLDGRNVRALYTKKKGWTKFGARHRLVDASDSEYGPAIPLFMSTLSDDLSEIATNLRWDQMVVFFEYWSPETLGGLITENANRELFKVTLFDIAHPKLGIVDPREYLKLTSKIGCKAHYFGKLRWTRGFVESVFRGELPVTSEGVVGKSTHKDSMILSKAKTSSWIAAIKQRYGEVEGQKMVLS